MTRKPRGKADPLEQEIEVALNPGAFIPDRACFSFVSDLDGVAAKIAKLTRSDPARAVTLYETFLAGCYEKAAGDLVAMNGELVGALLTVLCSNVKPEKLRAKAAISLGPVLEQAHTEGFEDMDDVPITQRTLHAIRETLRKTYLDADVPQGVRRRALEASVRAPQDWHRDAIRAVFNSGDEAWQLTATFCNALRARFRGGDPRGAGENPTIHYDPVCAAGNWEVDAAWPHISPPSPSLLRRRLWS